jgi:hypothetical protein
MMYCSPSVPFIEDEEEHAQLAQWMSLSLSMPKKIPAVSSLLGGFTGIAYVVVFLFLTPQPPTHGRIQARSC